MRKPEADRRRVTSLQHFLMRIDFREVVRFLHETKASWGVSRPHKQNDRRQSNAYRARIHVEGRFEHKASGDTAEAAICNALAFFLAHEHEDFHVLGIEQAA